MDKKVIDVLTRIFTQNTYVGQIKATFNQVILGKNFPMKKNPPQEVDVGD